MLKGYKYRLFPNKEQAAKFNEILVTCREFYNNLLTERRNYYETNKKSLTVFTQILSLPEKKRRDPRLSQIYSQILQDVCFRLDRAYAFFFICLKAKNGKVGYPHYKAANRYHSFTYPQYGGFKLTENGLRLSKIGIIKIKLHRSLMGKPKTCTIKREIDHWYACISCEIQLRPKMIPQKAIGIDMGLKNFATLSNSEEIINPKYLKLSERKLAKAQRKLSKKQKGSKNRRQQIVEVAKIHRKIKNQRNDFLHKLSRQITNSFDFIAIEDLGISSMVKNHYLAKSVSDASWGQFIAYLSYKAEEANNQVVKVDPRGTSQVCSKCGSIVKKSLSMRVHRCPHCGLVLPRDHNSAINILQRAVGREPPEFTPLEIAVGQSSN